MEGSSVKGDEPAQGAARKAIRFWVSKPVTDEGNKYLQRYDRWSPANVTASPSSVDGRMVAIGVRMEDYASVKPLDANTTFMAVSDGHGSVPALTENGNESGASRHIGGYESAQLATESVYQYVKSVADFIPLASLTKEGVAKVLYDAFAFAQRRCEQETMRGGKMVVAGQGSTSAHFAKERMGQLLESKIDGYHFKDLYSGRTPNPWDESKILVADKWLVPYSVPETGPVTGYLTYYVDESGQLKTIAEYGTTSTVVIATPSLSPLPEGTAMIYTANVGDSDAYLFFHQPTDVGWKFAKLTGDHTVENPAEVLRMSRFGMRPNGVYFTLERGHGSGHSLMPSRSFGHSLLSHHGVCFEPTVSSTLAAEGDFVIVASDGLWASYGRTLQHHASGSQTPEDLTAQEVCHILERDRSGNPNLIAQAIRDRVLSRVSVRDNLAIIVMKLTAK